MLGADPTRPQDHPQDGDVKRQVADRAQQPPAGAPAERDPLALAHAGGDRGQPARRAAPRTQDRRQRGDQKRPRRRDSGRQHHGRTAVRPGGSGDQRDAGADERRGGDRARRARTARRTGARSSSPARRSGGSTSHRSPARRRRRPAAARRCALRGPCQGSRVAGFQAVEEEPEHDHEADARGELQRDREGDPARTDLADLAQHPSQPRHRRPVAQPSARRGVPVVAARLPTRGSRRRLAGHPRPARPAEPRAGSAVLPGG